MFLSKLAWSRDVTGKVDNIHSNLTLAIAISETKLNSNNVSKIKIPNYNFLRSDSSTNAGGIGLYIKDTIKI